MGQRHVCTFRHAQRAAYRTAISAAAQTCFMLFYMSNRCTYVLSFRRRLRHFNICLPDANLQKYRLGFTSTASTTTPNWEGFSDLHLSDATLWPLNTQYVGGGDLTGSTTRRAAPHALRFNAHFSCNFS